MAEKTIVIAFDLYGTLLSTESIVEALEKYCGVDKAPQVAASWRRYQLEYTWRLNSMEVYKPFDEVTLNALKHATKEAGIDLKSADEKDLMKAYDGLSTFDDVKPALEELRNHSNVLPAVFSNGTTTMVSNSVHKSKDLAPLSPIFKKIIVVEEVKRFKPAPALYGHLAEQMGKKKSEMGEMWLVSGNPFDIVGARSAGMKAAWIDRSGNGWFDSLDEKSGPSIIAQSLKELVTGILKQVQQQ